MFAYRLSTTQAPETDEIMTDRDDVSLLRAIAHERDQQAFTELFERYREHAFNFAFRILQDAALAQDAVQEAMLSIWLSSKPVSEDANARAWILRSVASKSFDLGRSRKRRANREDRMVNKSNKLSAAAGDETEKNELIAVLREQIDSLPEAERHLVACYGAGISHHEISEMLGIPRRTVTDKIQQVLGNLRSALMKAGVAAVVPLVSVENLFEAMTTGQKCPPGLTAKVLLGKIAAKTVASMSSRGIRHAAPRSGAHIAQAGIVVAAVIAAGGIWWIVYAPPAKPLVAPLPAPVVSPAPPPEVKAPIEEPLYAHWTFENGPAPDLKAVDGNWQWKRPDAKLPGFMMPALNQSAKVVFPFQIPARPVLVTAHVLCQNPAGGNGQWLDNIWWDEQIPPQSKLRWRQIKPSPMGKRVARAYFIDRFVIHCIDQAVLAISEYRQPYPAGHIQANYYNFDPQEIELRSLRSDELSEFLRDPEKLIQELTRRKASGGELGRTVELLSPSK